MPFDSNLFFQIYTLGGRSYILDQLMIFGAEDVILLIFLIIFLLVFFGKTAEKKSAILLVIGLIIALLLIEITHVVFFKPRPFVTYQLPTLISHTQDASFPSGHTTIMAVILFAYVFCKSKFSPLFLLLMLWVGLARIYVGVHYPLDILGGIVYGLASIFLTSKLLNKFLNT